nr:MAG TPA: hypothetical protein [Caudoviricetes sp.]
MINDVSKQSNIPVNAVHRSATLHGLLRFASHRFEY